MDFIKTQGGIYVPNYVVKASKRPIAFDLFCGAGGMGCGLIQAGFEIVGANEFDAYAAISYMVNLGTYPVQIHYLDGEAGKERLDKAVARSWGLKKKYNGKLTSEVLKKAFGTEIVTREPIIAGSGWIKNTNHPGVKNFWFGDIHKLKGQEVLDTLGLRQGDLDLVAGGPPCQGYSKAGKQQIDDPRNTLVYEYARLIVELQPKTFIMEEVPDVLNFMDPDGVPVIDKFCMMLQDGGFGKWDMIKKSLAMQTGAAVAIRHPSGKKTVNDSKRLKRTNMDGNHQMSLFESKCGEL